MSEIFLDSSDTVYSYNDIEKAIYEVGADQYDTLFIHSDVMFGKPGKDFNRKRFLSELFEIVNKLNVTNIIVPTFTYSFCNNVVFDVANSKTSMGAFNEFVRKMDGRYRTEDPLLSVSVPAEISYLFESANITQHSLGKGCALDVLHSMNNVGFLFLGAELEESFTYAHYVEKMLNVPYRFDMPFEGDIILENGEMIHKKQYIFTHCKGAVIPSWSDVFANEMEEKGIFKRKRLADKYIGCISELDAYREIKDHLERDISYFLGSPFREEEMIREYTYNPKEAKITHC